MHALIFNACSTAKVELEILDLRCEYLENPIGIDV